MIKWITGRRPRASVGIFYVGMATVMFCLAVIDRGWLGGVAIFAGLAALAFPLVHSSRGRAALTSLIAFVMVGRLGLYLYITGLSTPVSRFTAATWVTLLAGLIALVSTDAELRMEEKIPSLEKLERLISETPGEPEKPEQPEDES